MAELGIGQALTQFDSSRERLFAEFFDFLRFPSISTKPERNGDVRACAGWVVEYLKNAGFSTELWETSGHPVVYAEYLSAGPSAPTLLFYNHYDVQPDEAEVPWDFPPFEPTVRDGEIFARGAQDNKGQCFYVMSALRGLLQRAGTLPVNVKLLIEGEEETGSAGLAELLPKITKRVQADHLFVVDLGFHSIRKPAVTLGVRGIVTMTVKLRGSFGDLHSGVHGGIVYNPNRALVELLARCYAADGSVAIPGFYDQVTPLPAEAAERLDREFDEEGFRHMVGALPTGGEQRFSAVERAWVRPTLEINGLSGGYAGVGFKTVIPAEAISKVSLRLVPDQDPDHMADIVSAFLKENTPGGIECSIEVHPGHGPALRSDPGGKGVEITRQVLDELFQTESSFILSGGSIPVVTALADASGAETVLLGLGLPTDNMHAPNEHFGENRVRLGYAMIQAIVSAFAP